MTRFPIVFFFLVLLLSAPSAEEKSQPPSFLQDSFSISLSMGGAIPLSSPETNETGWIYGSPARVLEQSGDASAGFAFRLGGDYNFLEYLSVGASFDFQMLNLGRFELAASNSSAQAYMYARSLGTIYVCTLLAYLEAHYRFDVGDRNFLMPYVQLGIGLNVNSFSESDRAVGAESAFDFSGTSMAVRIGGGVEYFYNDKVSLFLETSYNHNPGDFSIDFHSTPPTRFTGDSDFSSIQVMIGLASYF